MSIRPGDIVMVRYHHYHPLNGEPPWERPAIVVSVITAARLLVNVFSGDVTANGNGVLPAIELEELSDPEVGIGWYRREPAA